MNMIRHAAQATRPRFGRPFIMFLMLLAAWPLIVRADTAASGPTAAVPPYAQQTPEQLEQLVAPIALYPDSLVAQILAASTFPEQVVLGGSLGPAAPGPEGHGAWPGAGPAALGSEHQGGGGLPRGAGEHGQEPRLDVHAGRCLLQPAAGRDAGDPGDAAARAGWPGT